jgi:hypothetical protein
MTGHRTPACATEVDYSVRQRTDASAAGYEKAVTRRTSADFKRTRSGACSLEK